MAVHSGGFLCDKGMDFDLMNIRDVMMAIQQLQADGVVENHAIGDAVGATFYLEPVVTLDVDVFVIFRSAPDSLLIDLQPLFDYFKERGCPAEGEYIMIGGWPVQFLPPTGALVEEALEQAVTRQVGGVPTRVFTAEHLAAIALQTGRAKDKSRLLQFLEAGVLDSGKFQAILSRHGLTHHWLKFERQFLNNES